MQKKVIDPDPIIRKLADRCLKAKGMECSILGEVIDMLRAAPDVKNHIKNKLDCDHCDENGFCELRSNDAVVWKCGMTRTCESYFGGNANGK